MSRCAMELVKLASVAFGLLAAFGIQSRCLAQSGIESPPIAYSETADNNRVTDLIRSLKSGETTLAYDRESGYLKSLLEALEIPVSSQALVFSKTSMQITYISPQPACNLFQRRHLRRVGAGQLIDGSINERPEARCCVLYPEHVAA